MWIAAMISRRSWAIGWRRAIIRMALSSICALQLVDALRSLAMTRWARPLSRLDERGDRVGDLLLGEAAHLGDLVGEIAQLVVEGADGVFGHRSHPGPRAVSRSGR